MAITEAERAVLRTKKITDEERAFFKPPQAEEEVGGGVPGDSIAAPAEPFSLQEEPSPTGFAGSRLGKFIFNLATKNMESQLAEAEMLSAGFMGLGRHTNALWVGLHDVLSVPAEPRPKRPIFQLFRDPKAYFDRDAFEAEAKATGKEIAVGGKAFNTGMVKGFTMEEIRTPAEVMDLINVGPEGVEKMNDYLARHPELRYYKTANDFVINFAGEALVDMIVLGGLASVTKKPLAFATKQPVIAKITAEHFPETFVRVNWDNMVLPADTFIKRGYSPWVAEAVIRNSPRAMTLDEGLLNTIMRDRPTGVNLLGTGGDILPVAKSRVNIIPKQDLSLIQTRVNELNRTKIGLIKQFGIQEDNLAHIVNPKIDIAEGNLRLRERIPVIPDTFAITDIDFPNMPDILKPAFSEEAAKLPTNLARRINIKNIREGVFGGLYEETGGLYRPELRSVFLETGWHRTDPDTLLHEITHQIVNDMNPSDLPFVKDYIRARYPKPNTEKFIALAEKKAGFGGNPAAFDYLSQENIATSITNYAKLPSKRGAEIGQAIAKHYDPPPTLWTKQRQPYVDENALREASYRLDSLYMQKEFVLEQMSNTRLRIDAVDESLRVVRDMPVDPLKITRQIKTKFVNEYKRTAGKPRHNLEIDKIAEAVSNNRTKLLEELSDNEFMAAFDFFDISMSDPEYFTRLPKYIEPVPPGGMWGSPAWQWFRRRNAELIHQQIDIGDVETTLLQQSAVEKWEDALDAVGPNTRNNLDVQRRIFRYIDNDLSTQSRQDYFNEVKKLGLSEEQMAKELNLAATFKEVGDEFAEMGIAQGKLSPTGEGAPRRLDNYIYHWFDDAIEREVANKSEYNLL